VGNVVDDIVKDAVAGVVADGADDHFELFGKEQQDLIKILFIFDGLENVRIGVKRYLDAFVAGKDGRLYFQENIGEEIFDFPDILSAVVKHGAEAVQGFGNLAAVVGLDIVDQLFAVGLSGSGTESG